METRVQKFQKYRAELIKEGCDNKNADVIKLGTSTIPLSEVMNKAKDDSDSKYFKKIRRKKVWFYIAIVFGIALLTAGIIILGIFAFKGV